MGGVMPGMLGNAAFGWHGVFAAAAPRVATEDSLCGQPRAAQGSVEANGIGGVSGAGWRIATAADGTEDRGFERRQQATIDPEAGEQEMLGRIHCGISQRHEA